MLAFIVHVLYVAAYWLRTCCSDVTPSPYSLLRGASPFVPSTYDFCIEGGKVKYFKIAQKIVGEMDTWEFMQTSYMGGVP